MPNIKHLSIWACPVCKLPLSNPLSSSGKNIDRQWLCANQHSFDTAKEGYINLLLSHQKRSSSPGDTKLMVNSRQAFLAEGHYEPLAKKIISLIDKYLATNSVLLDSGCGEGYYLRQLLTQRNDIHMFGIDISKEAAKIVGRQIKNSCFAVASSFDLPVLTNSVDCLLRIFAPGNDAEAARILKETGTLVVVSAGPRHLLSLKKLLYQEAKEHLPHEALENFLLVNEEKLSYQVEIKNAERINQLVAMTPLYWRTSKLAQASLNELDCLSTEVDFIIKVYQPIKNNAWNNASIKV
jgi:23S rRNA (guanine745-N1)-methyltransferase